MIDVTSFGDVGRQFVPGLQESRFEIRGYPSVEFDPNSLVGAELPFEYDFPDGARIKASLFVVRVETILGRGRLTEVVIDAVANGPIQMTPSSKKKSAQQTPDLPEARRGIKL